MATREIAIFAEDLLPPKEEPVGACPTCGQEDYWMKPDGTKKSKKRRLDRVCRVCHPPPSSFDVETHFYKNNQNPTP